MQGFADGMMFPNLTVYIAEISSTELRGSLCNVVNICQCLGLCLTFSLSLLVPWRTLAWLLTAPVLLSLLGLSLVPETPHWLAQRNKMEEAVVVYTEGDNLRKEAGMEMGQVGFHREEEVRRQGQWPSQVDAMCVKIVCKALS